MMRRLSIGFFKERKVVPSFLSIHDLFYLCFSSNVGTSSTRTSLRRWKVCTMPFRVSATSRPSLMPYRHMQKLLTTSFLATNTSNHNILKM